MTAVTAPGPGETKVGPHYVKRTIHLPAPLVKPLQHPVKFFFWILPVSIVVALIAGHLGPPIITALYYDLFEVIPFMTNLWHHVPTGLRHGFFRAYQEFFLGGLLAQFVIWHAFKVRRIVHVMREETKIQMYERLLRIPTFRNVREYGLKWWQIPYGFLMAEIYGLVGFGAVWVVNFIVTKSTHDLHLFFSNLVTAHGHGVAADVQSVDTGTSDRVSKFEGLFASLFFGRRAIAGVFDGVQRWFAEQFVADGRKVRWFHHLLPVFLARINEVKAEVEAGTLNIAKMAGHQRLQRWLTLGAVVIGLALIVQGYYILTVIVPTAGH